MLQSSSSTATAVTTTPVGTMASTAGGHQILQTSTGQQIILQTANGQVKDNLRISFVFIGIVTT